VRILFVSDAHIFQTPAVGYDPIPDFKKACELMIELHPDIVVFAGDMFDYKRSVSSFVRWFEGEERMISVRPLLEKLGAEIYAIRGNHEREEILRGIAQTVKNFRYVADGNLPLDGVQIWFLDTRYEKGPNEAGKSLEEVCRKAREYEGMKILVTHESLEGRNAIPESALELASRTFDFVFNGHCHIWRKHERYQNIHSLPALLPSGLRLGSYWIERWIWEAKAETFRIDKRDAPFGMVLLDTAETSARFIPLELSKKIVEISVGTDGLTLAEVKRRFDEILGKLDNAIVFPEIYGTVGFPPEAISQFLKEKGDWVGELRSEVQYLSIPKAEISLPESTDVREVIRTAVGNAIKRARHLDEATVCSSFLHLLEDGRLAKPGSSPAGRLRELLLPLFENIREKPKYFDSDVEELLSVVKKVRR
jgi:predicted phosphodiesterase